MADQRITDTEGSVGDGPGPVGSLLAAHVPPFEPSDPVTAAGHPARAPRRRLTAARIGAVAVALVAVICCAIMVGEWAARTAEVDAIVDGIEDSEAAMSGAMADVSAIAGPGDDIVVGTDETAEQLKSIAAGANSRIAAAAARIESVSVQPWHREVIAARAAYLAHSRAWQDFLASAAADPAKWFASDARRDQIESTWLALAPLLADAVPTPAALGLESRVDTILHDDGGQTTDSGGATVQAAAAA